MKIGVVIFSTDENGGGHFLLWINQGFIIGQQMVVNLKIVDIYQSKNI
jgi:hypothetical protein